MAMKSMPWVRGEIGLARRNVLVCRPKELGGLGVTDLKLAGYALQTRWLWLQRTDDDRAWAEHPRSFFNSSCTIQLGDGNKALFWIDSWLEGQSVSSIAPVLCNAVPRRVQMRQTVAQALLNDPRNIWWPISAGDRGIPSPLEHVGNGRDPAHRTGWPDQHTGCCSKDLRSNLKNSGSNEGKDLHCRSSSSAWTRCKCYLLSV